MSLEGWKELPHGDSLAAGTAEKFETGDWRSEKPVWIKEKCIQCLQCWLHCPDSSITIENGKMTGFDYKHCKGCGICANVCPTKPDKSIIMESERS
jgi:pyruvate ferredoxin oxidoreductase delta subunit